MDRGADCKWMPEQRVRRSSIRRFSHLALTLAIAVALLSTMGEHVRAADQPLAYIVIDAGSGTVLDAENAGEPRYSASLVKLMGAYVAFEALDSGLMSEDRKLKVSANAASQQPVKAGLRAGQSVRFREALAASVIASANDAAVVVAEALSASEKAFAVRMTKTAQQLGMTGTRFGNATGLPHRDNVTTARDMAILAQAILERFSERRDLFASGQARIGKRRLGTTNGLIGSFPGTSGLKTGFTCWSGYNIVASAERDGRELIAVVLGSAKRASRNLKAIRLLQAGFRGERAEPTLRKVVYLPNAGPDAGKPPEVLSSKTCGSSGVVVASTTHRFRGWGILLGTYVDRRRANTVLKDSLAMLPPAQKRGRAAIFTSKRGNIRRYTPLLSGLTPAETREICRTLRERRGFCLVMGPKALNNPRAAWR